MSRDIGREKDSEAPPGLTVFLPRIYFFSSKPSERKRKGIIK